MPDTPLPARLFLITPRLTEASAFAPLLDAAVGAADIACVLVRTQARDEGGAKAIVRALAPIAQARDAAVLVEDDARLAARADADGVHMTREGPQLAEALAALHPKRIVGCGDLGSRDAAMRVGEAGVDYLMFGSPDAPEPDAVLERVGWWAQIFNVPCVGLAARPEDAGAIARAGAEFVALCEGLWETPEHVAALLRALAAELAASEPAL